MGFPPSQCTIEQGARSKLHLWIKRTVADAKHQFHFLEPSRQTNNPFSITEVVRLTIEKILVSANPSNWCISSYTSIRISIPIVSIPSSIFVTIIVVALISILVLAFSFKPGSTICLLDSQCFGYMLSNDFFDCHGSHTEASDSHVLNTRHNTR
ncbi:hypothetical protein Tco_0882219 [Tanacetum coccineum]